MALIETTDDFFCSVAKALNNSPDAYTGAQKTLDQLYMTLIKEKPNNQKSAILILDTFKKVLDDDIIRNLYKFVEDMPELESLIRDGKTKSSFYEQSIIIFVYWLIKRRKNILQKEWPLEWKIIQKMASDIGVSLERQA